MKQLRLQDPKINYSYGPFNELRKDGQWIRLTEGCPHNCPYCYEPQEIKIFPIPEIISNQVKIIDMNILCKPKALEIIKSLPKMLNGKKVEYEFVCGLDYRFLTQEIADTLKPNTKKIRLAWDWWYKDQYRLKDAIDMLLKSGYKPNSIMMFMICNWKIPFKECCLKLDLCKVWNVQVADCYFDNQVSPNIIPEFWTHEQIKEFRSKCRKHNQLVNFKIDPEEWRPIKDEQEGNGQAG